MKKDMKNNLLCASFALVLFAGFIMNILFPKDEFSMSERRKLASKPELSIQNIVSGNYMKQFEKYSVDHFVFRDQWRMLKALWSKNILQKQDNNGIYEVGGYLSMMDYPYKPKAIQHATNRFQTITDMYLDKNHQAYYSIIPDKNYFMTNGSGHLGYDYQQLLNDMHEQMKGIQYIDLFDLLTIEDYYKTDTHWRQEKILDVAKRLLSGMHHKELTNYEIKDVKAPFYGVYYGQAALPLQPDRMHYVENFSIQKLSVFDGQNKKAIPVYDMTKTTQKDPYEMYLGGPLSLVEVHNKKVKNNQHLIIFRDSFTSSLAPLLSSDYEHITLVDIRYLSYQQLAKYVDFKDSDMLFIYSTFVLNNSETIK